MRERNNEGGRRERETRRRARKGSIMERRKEHGLQKEREMEAEERSRPEER